MTCDGLRLHFKQEIIKEYGVDLMVERMKSISAKLSSEELEVLQKLSAATLSNATGIAEDLRLDASVSTVEIYKRAIERAGTPIGLKETHQKIGRTLTADPMTVSLQDDTYTPVLMTTPVGPQEPSVGAVSDVYLTVSPDQKSFKPLFLQIQSVNPSPNGGTVTNGQYRTLSDLAEGALPQQCAGIGSGLPAEKLNTLH